MNVFKFATLMALVLGGLSAGAARVDQRVMKKFVDACLIKGAEAKAKGLGPKNVDVEDLCSCLEGVHEDSVLHMDAPLARAHMASALAFYATRPGSPEEKQFVTMFAGQYGAETSAAEGCDQK